MVRLKKMRTGFFWPHPWRLLRGLQEVDWLLETESLNKNVHKKTSLVLLGKAEGIKKYTGKISFKWAFAN